MRGYFFAALIGTTVGVLAATVITLLFKWSMFLMGACK